VRNPTSGHWFPPVVDPEDKPEREKERSTAEGAVLEGAREELPPRTR